MINLLPPEKRRELKEEVTYHLVLILGVLLVLFCICLSLLLLSIRIYNFGEIQTQRILAESQKQEDEESPFGRIRSINNDVNGLNNFYQNQVVFSDIIVRIAAAPPNGIHLTSFEYTPVVTTKEVMSYARVNLAGFAPTSEDLLVFRANLEQDEMFGNFNFPSSNWNEDTDINFSFDFEVYPSSL
jgi:hypothetical protein